MKKFYKNVYKVVEYADEEEITLGSILHQYEDQNPDGTYGIALIEIETVESKEISPEEYLKNAYDIENPTKEDLEDLGLVK